MPAISAFVKTERSDEFHDMIHPTAVIGSGAVIAPDAEIGPYAIVGDGVEIGAGCSIRAHAQVLRGVSMGSGNIVDCGAVIGGDPQSLAFDSALPSRVRIGDGNTFREHVTVHRSAKENGETIVGHRNFLMAGCHVGHDTVIGDHTILANHVLVGGHVTIGNRCFLGGASVFHQFVRIGDLAMVQGNSGFSKDIPPYCTGFRENRVLGLNVVGLRRAGFDNAARLDLKRAWEAAFHSTLGPVKGAAAALASVQWTEASQNLLRFVANPGSKGIAVPGIE
jgi:UDP-N-acetylglucosamine acyltransferase